MSRLLGFVLGMLLCNACRTEDVSAPRTAPPAATRSAAITRSAGLHANLTQAPLTAEPSSAKLGSVSTTAPINATVLGTVQAAPPLGDIVDVDAEGALAFLARRGRTSEGSLHALEIATMLSTPPYVFARLTLPATPHALRVVDKLAYMLTDSAVLLIDVTSPNRPKLLANMNMPSLPIDIAVVDQHAYVVCQGGEISVLDVSDRAHPEVLNTISTGESNARVAAEPGRLYVSTHQRHLHVFALTYPAEPELLQAPELYAYGTPLFARERWLLADGHNAATRSVLDLRSDDSLGITQSFNHAHDYIDLDVDGNHGVLLTSDGILHRLSFGPEHKPAQWLSVRSPLSITSAFGAKVAYGHDRAVVTSGKQYAVADLRPPGCVYDGPLDISFDSTPDDLHATWVPWTAAEVDYLKRALGVIELNGEQACLGMGLLDRLFRFLGPPDPIQRTDGSSALVINFVKDPSASAPGSTTANDSTVRITLRVSAPGSLSQDHLPMLAHELTHALTRLSFPAFSLLVTEGVAVAAEMAIADDLFTRGGMTKAAEACEALNVPGIAMYRGSAWNQPITPERYIASGCFFLRQQRAHLALSNPDYFAQLRARTQAIATPGVPTIGAELMRDAIAESRPACIEGLSGEVWLARQHVFQLEPEVPSLEVYAAPSLRFSKAPAMALFMYKREVDGNGWARESTPDFTVDQEPSDPDSFYAATFSSGWSLYDELGSLVGPAVQPFEIGLDPMLIGRPYFRAPNTDDALVLPACRTDFDGDGEARCRTRREGFLRVDYTDPTSGETRNVERRVRSYTIHNTRNASLRGVVEGFSSGVVRVTFPLINAALDAVVEGGVFFAPGHNSQYYALETPGPVCSVLPRSRHGCRLASKGWNCPQTTPISAPDIRRYRGPVRVEQHVSGFAGGSLLNPRTYSKLSDDLDLVY